MATQNWKGNRHRKYEWVRKKWKKPFKGSVFIPSFTHQRILEHLLSTSLSTAANEANRSLRRFGECMTEKYDHRTKMNQRWSQFITIMHYLREAVGTSCISERASRWQHYVLLLSFPRWYFQGNNTGWGGPPKKTWDIDEWCFLTVNVSPCGGEMAQDR